MIRVVGAADDDRLIGIAFEKSHGHFLPDPRDGHETMSDEKKAFYEYHCSLMEPWVYRVMSGPPKRPGSSSVSDIELDLQSETAERSRARVWSVDPPKRVTGGEQFDG